MEKVVSNTRTRVGSANVDIGGGEVAAVTDLHPRSLLFEEAIPIMSVKWE